LQQSEQAIRERENKVTVLENITKSFQEKMEELSQQLKAYDKKLYVVKQQSMLDVKDL